MTLFNIRKKIDKIDDKIIDLLEKRFLLAKEVKKFKKKIKDKKREEEILSKIKSIYIQDIYKIILKNSKRMQKNDI